MNDVLTDLQNIDLLIRQGNIFEARNRLKKINHKRIPPKERAFAARISWRIGLPNYGLHLLAPFVREQKSVDVPAREIAEYASCLNAVGGNEEAERRLQEFLKENPGRNQNAWVLMALAFVKISAWDYQSAYFLLQKICNAPEKNDLSDYILNVAMINFLSTQISLQKWDEATETMRQLDERLATEDYRRLRSNLRELKLQLLVGQKDYSSALQMLSGDSGKELQGPEKIYFLKWKFIIETHTQTHINMDYYQKIRDMVVQAGHWEVVRDVDARFAIANKNDIFLKRVLYSSPWLSYRRHLLNLFKAPIVLDNIFSYYFWPESINKTADDGSASQEKISFDFLSGIIRSGGNEVRFKNGNASFRLLRILASDLYRPHSVGSIFCKLFPSEYFNPVSSPNRIHQAILALRDFLKHEGVPLKVENKGAAFRLITEQPVELLLPWGASKGKLEDNIEMIKMAFSGSKFDIEDVVLKTKIHQKAVQRLLKKGFEEGLLKKTGKGRGTRYYFET